MRSSVLELEVQIGLEEIVIVDRVYPYVAHATSPEITVDLVTMCVGQIRRDRVSDRIPTCNGESDLRTW